MSWDAERAMARGFDALRLEVLAALAEAVPALAGPVATSPGPRGAGTGRLYAESTTGAAGAAGSTASSGPGSGDAGHAVSSEATPAERDRLIALVELARSGDKDAFGLLFDHYHLPVYRFVHHRTHSQTVAEDITSETFFRALRSMGGFRWQGKDFGAWLMTIARNLVTDHFKAGRTRLELVTEDMALHDAPTEGPEEAVLAALTNEALLGAMTELHAEQRDCLVLRFLQGMSIAETAAVLQRSEGAVKQLQLRAVRNLAKLIPPEEAR